jgi:hypothetical protein
VAIADTDTVKLVAMLYNVFSLPLTLLIKSLWLAFAAFSGQSNMFMQDLPARMFETSLKRIVIDQPGGLYHKTNWQKNTNTFL